MIDIIWNKYFVRQFSNQVAVVFFIFFALFNPQTKAEQIKCSQVFLFEHNRMNRQNKEKHLENLVQLNFSIEHDQNSEEINQASRLKLIKELNDLVKTFGESIFEEFITKYKELIKNKQSNNLKNPFSKISAKFHTVKIKHPNLTSVSEFRKSVLFVNDQNEVMSYDFKKNRSHLAIQLKINLELDRIFAVPNSFDILLVTKDSKLFLYSNTNNELNELPLKRFGENTEYTIRVSKNGKFIYTQENGNLSVQNKPGFKGNLTKITFYELETKKLEIVDFQANQNEFHTVMNDELFYSYDNIRNTITFIDFKILKPWQITNITSTYFKDDQLYLIANDHLQLLTNQNDQKINIKIPENINITKRKTTRIVGMNQKTQTAYLFADQAFYALNIVDGSIHLLYQSDKNSDDLRAIDYKNNQIIFFDKDQFTIINEKHEISTFQHIPVSYDIFYADKSNNLTNLSSTNGITIYNLNTLEMKDFDSNLRVHYISKLQSEHTNYFFRFGRSENQVDKNNHPVMQMEIIELN